MTDTTERPPVTFAVIAYNQERYIREAIEGAFAQTYQPLEIILSDDGSPDRTYQIMQEMAAAYDGPHKVVLNRNEPNLGLVPHIDRVMELVSGEFIVVSAGDDISCPQRTEKMVTAWRQSAKNVTLVHSLAESIKDSGEYNWIRPPPERMMNKPTSRDIIQYALHVVGATAGWDRRVFTEFGPLAPGLEIEDHIIPLRASFIGDLSFINEPLVKNRVGGMSFGGYGGVYDYLYTSGHRKRKWILETDEYILRRFFDLAFSGDAELKAICERRRDLFKVPVELAKAHRLGRILKLPFCLSMSLKHQSTQPVKDWAKYNFDWIYVPVRQALQKSANNRTSRDKVRSEKQ